MRGGDGSARSTSRFMNPEHVLHLRVGENDSLTRVRLRRSFARGDDVHSPSVGRDVPTFSFPYSRLTACRTVVTDVLVKSLVIVTLAGLAIGPQRSRDNTVAEERSRSTQREDSRQGCICDRSFEFAAWALW